ncbi:MAG: glycosyl transferase family 1 [Candidatus Solibacter sp.]|nr:glycosyl transferase family 1 [Candidatus Solibacter sp.]
MKILTVHNAYRHLGGEDVSRQTYIRLLEERGHEVDSFDVSNADYSTPELVARSPLMVYNPFARSRLKSAVALSNPDIVHFHNTFPLLSPAVFGAAAALGRPVVFSIHNYRLFCLNACLYREARPCQLCIGKHFPWPGLIHRCYRGSYLASALCSASVYAHWTMGTWSKHVDMFLPVSQFAAGKLVEAGVAPARISVHYNTVYPDPGPCYEKKGFFLFAGRLDEKKGLLDLLESWRSLQPDHVRLVIVGDGPLMRAALEAQSQLKNLSVLGPRPQSDVSRLMGEAQAVVVPSRSFETFGRVVMEAAAKATSSVATAAGGLSEQVVDGETGILVEAGSPLSLSRALSLLIQDPSRASTMGRNARKRFQTNFAPDIAYTRLLSIYTRLLTRRKQASSS